MFSNLEHEVKSGLVYAIVLIGLALTAFAFGKYGQPSEVITKDKIVSSVDQKEDKTAVVAISTDSHIVLTHHDDTTTTTTVTTTPAGEKTQTTVVAVDKDTTEEHVVDKQQTVTHTDDKETDKKSEEDKEKIVKNSAKPQWLVGIDLGITASPHHLNLPASATGGILGLGGLPLVGGVRVEKQVIGPIDCGVWAHSDVSGGLTCDIRF